MKLFLFAVPARVNLLSYCYCIKSYRFTDGIYTVSLSFKLPILKSYENKHDIRFYFLNYFFKKFSVKSREIAGAHS